MQTSSPKHYSVEVHNRLKRNSRLLGNLQDFSNGAFSLASLSPQPFTWMAALMKLSNSKPHPNQVNWLLKLRLSFRRFITSKDMELPNLIMSSILGSSRCEESSWHPRISYIRMLLLNKRDKYPLSIAYNHVIWLKNKQTCPDVCGYFWNKGEMAYFHLKTLVIFCYSYTKYSVNKSFRALHNGATYCQKNMSYHRKSCWTWKKPFFKICG